MPRLTKAQRIRAVRKGPDKPSSWNPDGTLTEEDALYGIPSKAPKKVMPELTPMMRRIYAYMEPDVLYLTRGIYTALNLKKGSVESALNAMYVKHAVDKQTMDTGVVVWRKNA